MNVNHGGPVSACTHERNMHVAFSMGAVAQWPPVFILITCIDCDHRRLRNLMLGAPGEQGPVTDFESELAHAWMKGFPTVEEYHKVYDRAADNLLKDVFGEGPKSP